MAGCSSGHRLEEKRRDIHRMRRQAFRFRSCNNLRRSKASYRRLGFAEKTVSYAVAKTAYFNALRDAVPELVAIAIGKEARSPGVDRFAESFSIRTFRRRGLNSTGRRRSKRNSITISMLSISPIDKLGALCFWRSDLSVALQSPKTTGDP